MTSTQLKQITVKATFMENLLEICMSVCVSFRALLVQYNLLTNIGHIFIYTVGIYVAVIVVSIFPCNSMAVIRPRHARHVPRSLDFWILKSSLLDVCNRLNKISPAIYECLSVCLSVSSRNELFDKSL